MSEDSRHAAGPHAAGLRRRLGLTALVFYGVGDILGAGIYALVGEVAGMAGRLSWLSFLIALVVASLTGLSYAELGSRFPRSGGEAHFCRQAFRPPAVATVIGWMVFWSSVLSLSTVSRAFAGYLQVLIPGVPAAGIVIALLILLAAINFFGIQLSSATNIVCTLIEASGLLLVICAGLAFLADPAAELAARAAGAGIPEPSTTMFGVIQAATLAFFAFIGFEDMVNVAEEAKNPQRNMPLAIILAAAIAGTMYIVVIVIATRVVAPQELAASKAPLLQVVLVAAPAIPTWLFTAIALFAVANTGLLNFVTASRLLYGMSQDGLLPQALGRVHRVRGTPHYAVWFVWLVAVVLATTGTLAYLAGTTSIILLSVFLTMNIALIRVKRQQPAESVQFRVPTAIPVLGAVVCLALLMFTSISELVAASLLVLAGSVLALYRHRRSGGSSGGTF
ncbi:MAG: APC family permease [Fuerstiella sp.]